MSPYDMIEVVRQHHLVVGWIRLTKMNLQFTSQKVNSFCLSVDNSKNDIQDSSNNNDDNNDNNNDMGNNNNNSSSINNGYKNDDPDKGGHKSNNNISNNSENTSVIH